MGLSLAQIPKQIGPSTCGEDKMPGVLRMRRQRYREQIPEMVPTRRQCLSWPKGLGHPASFSYFEET